MNVESIRDYCLNKKEVTESLPFNDTALVMKVNGKMFAIIDLSEKLRISLKCDPEKVPYIIEKFESITTGYHLNKKHWITVYIDGSIEEDYINKWIDDSYRLIVRKMPLKDRDRLLIP